MEGFIKIGRLFKYSMFKYTIISLQRTIASSIISMKKCIRENTNIILLVLDVEGTQMSIKKIKRFLFVNAASNPNLRNFLSPLSLLTQYRCSIFLLSLN